MMKKIFERAGLGKALIIMFFLTALNAYTQVGIQTNSPDASSALDIVATDKGLLIPRVTLTSNLNNASPVTSPATGLLVFNSGANQPQGFYYWNGSAWTSTGGSASTDYWSLTGNSGTTVGTNFLGTTDAEDFAIYSNNAERMRFTSSGQGLVGLTSAYATEDFFTIESNATQYYALNVYSPGVGNYISAGTFGLIAFVDNASGYPQYVKNLASSSYGGFIVGSNRTAYTLSSHYTGLSSHGDDGLFCLGQLSNGIGVIAAGNNQTTVSTISDGVGGAFTGYHGIYAKAINSGTGIGVIGVGNNGGTYYSTTSGSGGAFTGYHGSIATASNSNGTGVIGVGNAGSYYLFDIGSGRDGSGGAFTGDWCGVAGWATINNNNSVGVYGYYDGAGSGRDGRGVIGIGAANSGSGDGVYGQGGRWGVYANGNLGASGTKSFAIDHPSDPENKMLKHYSIESNEVLNMYRGVAEMDENGEVTVTLPDYFLVININFSYTLTSIGVSSPDLYIKEEINDQRQFTIGGGKPNQKVSWVVYADRNDPYMQKYRDREVDVVEKEPQDKGKYIMPELYGKPEEMGMFYIDMGRKVKKPVANKTVETKVSAVSEKDIRKPQK